MRKQVCSHPIGCEKLNRMSNVNKYEVMLENHETLDTIVCFEHNGDFYHLDMLFGDELMVDLVED